ncbi:MAG TPA: hypothetical protein VJ499_10685 [Flavisolibacter sp.]|nr:hypothetical protein [Flavisolibacter sp.]
MAGTILVDVMTSKPIFMRIADKDQLDSTNIKDTRSEKYTEANDRATEMTDMEACLKRLETKGYTDQFRVEKGKLFSIMDSKKKYKAKDVMAANFFRFEGISNPDDMSVLYAIETADGNKGTLVDAYGLYADDDTGEFMKEVEIHKKVTQGKLD